MKKILYISISTLIFFFLYPKNIIFSQSKTETTQEANESTSEADLEVIKENVKKRLENVIKETDQKIELTSYIGTLQSIATTTLSIETKDSLKLASTSANTKFFRLPKKEKLNLEDISIGEYISSIGSIQSEGVIDSSIILISKEKPKPSKYLPFFGIIQSIDEKNPRKITLLNLKDSQTKDFLISKKATINSVNSDNIKNKINFDEIKLGQYILVHYLPTTDEDQGDHVIYQLLVKTSVTSN